MGIRNKVNPEAPSAGRKTRNDIIFISAVLILICLAAIAMFIFKTEGDTVTVTVDGKRYAEYPLGEDTSVEIQSPNGFNLLVIEGGEAYVKSASCPDGICSSHRPIKNDGESIICLPNKVVVEVHSVADESRALPDIVA